MDDPGIFALSTSDTNYIRNHFYLIFCDATQRDLTSYFSRCGIKFGGVTYGLTPSVIATVQREGYAAWDGNIAPTALFNPGTLAAAEDALTGAPLATFTTTDSDPGEIFTYQIPSGNADSAFTIDKHSGGLRVSPRGLDRKRAPSYPLTVASFGNGIPFGASTRPALGQTFTVNVSNVAESPQVGVKIFSATSAMGAGPSLGTMNRRQLSATDITFSIEQSTTLPSWAAVTPTEQMLADDGITRVIKAKVPTGGGAMKMLRLTVTRP